LLLAFNELIVQQMVANCQSAENIVNWQQINEME
jgi:hypothetical protein